MSETTSQSLRNQQKAWASSHNIPFDPDGYCLELNDNLFFPLSRCSRRDFESGDGSELDRGGGRSKLQALHSSSALVCNFFDYWRGRDLCFVGRALGLGTPPCGMLFEHKYPTGLRGTSPNLDVVFTLWDGEVFAIESKFTEPYSRSLKKGHLKDAYFPVGTGLWTDNGLPGCQRLAENLRKGSLDFQLLDVAQLLKHMLGLAKNEKSWRLLYLWYNTADEVAKAHEEEIVAFVESIGADERRFSEMSYQELFSRVAPELTGEHDAYRKYLAERYFSQALSKMK